LGGWRTTVGIPITMAVFCLDFSDIVIVSSWGFGFERDACLVLVLVGCEPRWFDFTCQPSDGKPGLYDAGQ
jgi:hypothetical protein